MYLNSQSTVLCWGEKKKVVEKAKRVTFVVRETENVFGLKGEALLLPEMT